MRTQKEIVAECKRDDDFFGFRKQVLVQYLDFDHAREFLKPEIKREEWSQKLINEDSIKKEMASYSVFGWEKIENHRGISSNRTIDKMESWLFLLCDTELLEKVESAPYAQYGAPKLYIICRTYGFEIPDNECVAKMITGSKCRPNCDEGCGNSGLF